MALAICTNCGRATLEFKNCKYCNKDPDEVDICKVLKMFNENNYGVVKDNIKEPKRYEYIAKSNLV